MSKPKDLSCWLSQDIICCVPCVPCSHYLNRLQIRYFLSLQYDGNNNFMCSGKVNWMIPKSAPGPEESLNAQHFWMIKWLECWFGKNSVNVVKCCVSRSRFCGFIPVFEQWSRWASCRCPTTRLRTASGSTASSQTCWCWTTCCVSRRDSQYIYLTMVIWVLGKITVRLLDIYLKCFMLLQKNYRQSSCPVMAHLQVFLLQHTKLPVIFTDYIFSLSMNLEFFLLSSDYSSSVRVEKTSLLGVAW